MAAKTPPPEELLCVMLSVSSAWKTTGHEDPLPPGANTELADGEVKIRYDFLDEAKP